MDEDLAPTPTDTSRASTPPPAPPTPPPPAAMPYAVNAVDLPNWHAFVESSAWDKAARKDLIIALAGVQFFVSTSRVDGINAIVTFRQAARDMDEIISTDRRFTGEWYSDYSPGLNDILADIQNALSWRDTNVAKDTEVHKNVRAPTTAEPTTGDQKGFLGQSAQDSLRAFTIHQRRLAEWFRQHLWYQHRVETELRFTWS